MELVLAFGALVVLAPLIPFSQLVKQRLEGGNSLTGKPW
jgi:hypothetical protein